jgi:hypothetical protein
MEQDDTYDYHGAFNEYCGIAVVGKNGKYGFIGRNGEEITPLKYDIAQRWGGDFSEVCINGKWGLIDISGKEITPLIYDEVDYFNYYPFVKLNGKYGFINYKTGELLTPIKYDCVCPWERTPDSLTIGIALAKVQLDGKWGCIDTNCREVIPPKYDELDMSDDDLYIPASIDGKWGFVDNTGIEITLFEYDSVCSFHLHCARVEKNGKYGYINDKGGIVIPIIYDDCEPQLYESQTHDDEYIFIPCRASLNGKYGYINIIGVEVIKFRYEYATMFHDYYNGMTAAVVLNGKVGFIDATGKEIIPCIYEPLDDPKNYDCRHYRFDNGFANVKHNGKWGVIDRNNKVVIPFLYDDFLENDNIGWRYAIRDGKTLTIDTKGHERLVKKNPRARTFKDFLSTVTLEEVIEKGRSLFNFSDEEAEGLKKGFNEFYTRQPRPSKNFMRIHTGYDSPIDVHICSVKDKCSYSYSYFPLEEVLDMEVRLEDELTLSDAEIVVHCILHH